MFQIKTVTIIGGNGTMGSLMAGIISSFGEAKVYLVSRNKQDSVKVIENVKKSVRSDTIENNLIPIDYSGLEDAIKESDWIYESIVEDYNAKAKVYKIINESNENRAIISTGTSGLSINELALNFSEENRKRFLGTHFFNPPYSLNLCELIPSQYIDKKVFEDMKEYLNNTLNRTVIIVKDKPAFIANRIGFEFLNELLQLAESYQKEGGIDYIDSLFSGYTGRSMRPLETVDFVGLDIHKAIVDNIYINTDDEYKDKFICPKFIEELIRNKRLGRKTNEGLYKSVVENGNVIKQVYDIKKKEYRAVKKYENNNINKVIELIKIADYKEAYKILIDGNTRETDLVVKLLINYIVYSLIISNICSENINDCDKAMAEGFNWCPPIALKKLIREVTDLRILVDKFVKKDIIEKYKVYDLLKKSSTTYDYRRYLKAI